MLVDNFDSTTNHLNLSPRFLDCLMLDLTVIDFMPIAHMDKIWVVVAKKNLRCGRRGGGGGSSVISDSPGRGGRGGQKRANFCRRPLSMAPKIVVEQTGLSCQSCHLSINMIHLVNALLPY